MLAQLPAAQVRALLPSRQEFVDRTGRGPTSPTALARVLAEDRRRGWSQEDGFIVDGYSSVAAAAFDRSQRPLASVGLTFRSDRVDAAGREALARAAVRAARELSRRMGA
jgi:DNA-binding IclR family transcriptional regulator